MKASATSANEYEPSLAASLLDLDEAEVERRSIVNTQTHYGVVLVAGHRIRDEAGDLISTWEQEVKNVTSGKVVLDSGFSHSTVANICRSQPVPVTTDDLQAIGFDRFLMAIQNCHPYGMHFQQVKLSDKRDGNIVLVTHTKSGELGDLQYALNEAGLTIERANQEAGRTSRAFVTLSHLSSDTLATLTLDEISGLKEWIRIHSVLDERSIFRVKELKVVSYCDRRLRRMMADDLVFPLGRQSALTGNEVREAILAAAGAQNF